MATITVMNPQGGRPAAKLAVPPLPADLRGLTVGFLDNTKHNFDLLVQEMGALLKERFGAKRMVLTHLGREVLQHRREIELELAHDGLVVTL